MVVDIPIHAQTYSLAQEVIVLSSASISNFAQKTIPIMCDNLIRQSVDEVFEGENGLNFLEIISKNLGYSRMRSQGAYININGKIIPENQLIQKVTLIKKPQHGILNMRQAKLGGMVYSPNSEYVGKDYFSLLVEADTKRFKLNFTLIIKKDDDRDAPSSCNETPTVNVNALFNLFFQDLPNQLLAQTITLDTNAAGHGWFTNPQEDWLTALTQTPHNRIPQLAHILPKHKTGYFLPSSSTNKQD